MISIIVPIYNVELYLRQCLESIVNQTYRDIEILLIDDGSPDKCGEICEEYARIDHRIRVFHTENKGLSAARNLGLQEAKGEYIGFVDSDDWIEPDMYEILLQSLRKEKADISVCDYISEYVGNKQVEKIVQPVVYTEINILRALIGGQTHENVWNKLYVKNCWKDISFPEGHSFEDIATLYKVFLKTNIAVCVSKALYHYRLRGTSISHSHLMNNLMDCWNAYYKRYLFLNALPNLNTYPDIQEKQEEHLAKSAARTWRWIYSVPKNQRDYEFLRMVSFFLLNHISFFRLKNLGVTLRINFFFTRYVNDVVFTCLYFLTQCFLLFRRHKRKPEVYYP